MRNLPFSGLNGFAWFQGVVENTLDPLETGQVQVRIFGIHSEEKIPDDSTGHGTPTEDLPWAQISCSVESASTSGVGSSPTGIVNGTHVWGFARDGRDFMNLVICGTFVGVPTKKSTGLGFEDPESVYPKRVNESDISRLARANTKETWVETQKKTKTKNELFEEPESAYAAKYPMNHVFETRSGHVFERDDTPGKERITVVHKTNTYSEIRPDGSQVEKIVKDNYRVIMGDDFLHVGGNVKVFIHGNVDQVVEGNINEHVKGSVTRKIDGNLDETIDGAVNRKIGSSLTENISSSVSRNVGSSLSETISSGRTINAGTSTTKAGNITHDGPVKSTKTIDAAMDISSAMNVKAAMNLMAGIAITGGGMSASGGVMTVEKDATIGGISYKGHKHSTSSSGGPSSTPY